MAKPNVEFSAIGAAPSVQYISELQRLYETYSLIEFIPYSIELTEKYFHFINGQDRKKMLIDKLSELVEIDKALLSNMIDLAFYIGRNKHFIKLVKKNCKCVYWCNSDNKVINDSLH